MSRNRKIEDCAGSEIDQAPACVRRSLVRFTRERRQRPRYAEETEHRALREDAQRNRERMLAVARANIAERREATSRIEIAQAANTDL